MFEKILVANRGEIACRIMRSCERLGIATVAVFSEADIGAPFVRMANERVFIGPSPAAQSYLVIDKIVEACRRTGAQAVHPGYGFLSERAEFVDALEAAGIAFIGPSAAAVRAMGDKIESKRLAQAAGVSTVPGTLEPVTEADAALDVAREIGFPVMVKAAAGGGGKGMRVARDEHELIEGLERARSEARSSFGDDRVFLEKFVETPRHIEIQVLGDRQGKVVHLGERECSIQRRHQKVIEEAPSPFLDPTTRAAMGEQACALARAVGYHSAGTVEFIVDRNRAFYFLEMNTRLQVEHPVTELVTGLDLVEQMIRVAAGEPLGFDQAAIRLDGWAIEARVYAEDPRRGFVPSTGRLVRYQEPELDGLRIDSGVVEGSEISMFYDPMVAKICAHASDRAAAAERLREGLDAFQVRGPQHNLAFLNAVVGHPRFLDGEIDTSFIAEEYGERFEPAPPAPQFVRDLSAIAVALRLIEAERAGRTSGRLTERPVALERDWTVQLGEDRIAVRLVDKLDVIGFRFAIGDHSLELALDWRPGLVLVRATADGRRHVVQADPASEGFVLRSRGHELRVLVRTARAAAFAARMPPRPQADTSRVVTSPMPGTILSIAVASGDEVKAGQELCVLEAMKMENVLRAERDATVAEVRVAARDAVAADQVLLTFA